jgi:hypothetical protein
MREHRLEVADVFRTYEKEFFAKWGHVISPCQRKAFNAIRDCRTAALGGHVEYVEQCDTCGHRVISYNSCRNRNCPKCQAAARARWLAAREAELLPVPYFHVVFTLPEKLGRLALQNAREIYSILFRAASETLLTIAADPKRLGAALGFLAVLHTWGQNLHLHPHLHCVVPGGGIGADGKRWIPPIRCVRCRTRACRPRCTGAKFPIRNRADLTVLTVPRRFVEMGDAHAEIDGTAGSLELLLELTAKDKREGLPDAPWPPHFRKMEGEAPRVTPSRAKKAAAKSPPRKAPSAPLITVANSPNKQAALNGLERWKGEVRRDRSPAPN